MTDEELAEERATKFTDINFNEPDNYGSEKEVGHFSYRAGFLAGLEAGSEKLDIYRKAFCLFVNWAEECGFGYDHFRELEDKYKKELEDMGYIEGLMLIAIKEAKAKKNFPKLYLKEIESVEKELAKDD